MIQRAVMVVPGPVIYGLVRLLGVKGCMFQFRSNNGGAMGKGRNQGRKAQGHGKSYDA